jgi:oligopeptide/dipeptide ABC transporter ATP-binding protein
MNKTLLDVKNLVTCFDTPQGIFPVVDNINFHVDRQECFGIIGESGCGKSMTAMSIIGYASYMGAQISNGEVIFDGVNLLSLSPKQWRGYRGNRISIILQNPMNTLNPLFTVGNQVEECIRLHHKTGHKAARKKVKEFFNFLDIPVDKIDQYPFQLSGGILQRVAGAIAICSNPDLIIADEPTTALDATVQIQFLQLLKHIQSTLHTSLILISHDIRVITMMCNRVAVMYAGKIIEQANTFELLNAPLHPYTDALLRSTNSTMEKAERLYTIEGQPPYLLTAAKKCSFAPRCPYREHRCDREFPPQSVIGTGQEEHLVNCWRIS